MAVARFIDSVFFLCRLVFFFFLYCYVGGIVAGLIDHTFTSKDFRPSTMFKSLIKTEAGRIIAVIISTIGFVHIIYNIFPLVPISKPVSEDEQYEWYQSGFDDGYDEGYDIGYSEGVDNGLEIYYDDAYEDGYSEGYNDALNGVDRRY